MADQVTKKTIRQLSINDQVVTNVNVDNVVVDSKLSSGTKIASIQINGTTTDLFAPEQALLTKVSMSKIVLDDDFEFRGNYVFGKKSDLTSVVHYSKGTNLWSMFKDMFMLEDVQSYDYYYGALSEPVDIGNIDSSIIQGLASGAQMSFPSMYVQPSGTKQIIFACKLSELVKNATRIDLATANGLEDASLERIDGTVSIVDTGGNAVEYVVFQSTTKTATTADVTFNKVSII